jgi:hypothetical protein
LADNLHLLNIKDASLIARKKLLPAQQKPTHKPNQTDNKSESSDDEEDSESDLRESMTTHDESESDTDESEDDNGNKHTGQPNTAQRRQEEDDDIIILSANDNILEETHGIAAPTETTYYVACYISRNTSPTMTSASYDPITNFTIPATTNSYIDNLHYQAIKTHAWRWILAKEPLKSLIFDGVAIQLDIPSVYYPVKGGDKQKVPLPLDTETMARIPEPKYYINNDSTTFAFLSFSFIMTLDYYYIIQRTIKKIIWLLQEQPEQSHPIDRILTQFRTIGVSRQTQTTPEDTQTEDKQIKSTSINPATPQRENSNLTKRRRIEFSTSTTSNTYNNRMQTQLL